MERFVRIFVLLVLSTSAVFGSISVDDIVIIPRHTFDTIGYSGTVDVSRYDGKVHVAWVRSGKIRYTIRNENGEWTEPEVIDIGNIYVDAVEYNYYNIPNSKRCVDIFIDRDNVTHMVFADKYGSIYYMYGSVGNWSEPEKLVVRWHDSIYPDIVVKNNDIFIIYEDAEEHEIFFISRLKGVWQPVRNMGPGMHGTLSLGSNGMIYFAYRFWDGMDKKYNVVFAYMIPYQKDWTYVGTVHPTSTNPLPELTDAEKRVEHGPYLTSFNGYIYLAWPHRTLGVDSPSPKKCELFLAVTKEPGKNWDWNLKYGRSSTLFYVDTSAPFPRATAYSDSTILYYNSRRTGPFFMINQNGKWSKTRTTRPIDLWTMGISQVATDGRTVWILSSLYKGLNGSIDITGLTNPEASQFNWSNNNPEIYTSPDTIAVVGQKWQYSCRGSDVDGDNLVYSLVLAPDSMNINKYTGDIEWNVTNESEAVTFIGVKVDDGKGGNYTQYFRIRISPPEADFTAEPRSGYAPLTVNFTDVSGGTVTEWLWDFGDGSTSTEQNPVHVYGNPGTYSVILTVTSESGSSRKEKPSYITVLEPPPVADFTADPLSGLKPLTVTFTDKSTGNISSYKWDFGDGTTSTEQNPSHTYQESGIYSVHLCVTGPGGSDEKTMESYISVASEPPSADFIFYPAKGEMPLSVTLTDKSSGIITDYNWNFGDGYSSNEKNPEHTYSSTGVYSVSLTVTGPGGNDTKTVDSAVVVTPPLPVPDFEADTTVGVVPFTVLFENKTTGVTDSLTWDFGDGGNSSDSSPSHRYESVGYYTVRLKAWRSGEGKTKTRENYITVIPSLPYADFIADTLQGIWPFCVKFTDRSIGDITSWRWRFGNGDYSSEQNPEYIYNKSGDYTVTLIVMGPSGIDSVMKRNYITVFDPPPSASFTCDTTSGNKPLVVHFYDNSEGPVTEWLWNFGDGNTSTEQNPLHTYTEEGVYSVTLKVTGPGGTDSTSANGLINVTVDAVVYEQKTINPQSYVLYQNFPNPFNSETVVSFYLPVQSFVEISVFDVRGEKITVLKRGIMGRGTHRIAWKGTGSNGIEVPTGIYLIQMRTKAGIFRQKAAFIK